MRLLRGPLVAAGLYALVLLPPLLAPHGGGHAHARAYLLEFGGIPLTRLLGDVLLNVAAFVPLGGFLALAERHPTRSLIGPVLVATGAALLLSLGVETLQRFMISRYSSLLDVLANGGGAALGALAVTRWRRAG